MVASSSKAAVKRGPPYETKNERLLSGRAFARRMAKHAAVAYSVVFVSLAVGVLGYHVLERLPWIDALLNASMILGGMGPVDPLHTVAGKLFASFYALYSGVVFLVVCATLLGPLIHRMLHHFHVEMKSST